MALRTVPWLTLKRAARSISLGMAALGFHSPACRLCKISVLICWYSGLKAGVELETALALLPVSVLAGPVLSLMEVDSVFIKCARKTVCKVSFKSVSAILSIISYIRHKTS